MNFKLGVRGVLFVVAGTTLSLFPAIALFSVAALVLVSLWWLFTSRSRKVLKLYLKLNSRNSRLLTIQFLLVILILVQLHLIPVYTSSYFRGQYGAQYFPAGHLLVEKEVMASPEGLEVSTYAELVKFMPSGSDIYFPETSRRFKVDVTSRQIYYLDALLSWRFRYNTTLENTDVVVSSNVDSFAMVLVTPVVGDFLQLPQSVDVANSLVAVEVDRSVYGGYDYFQLGNIASRELNLSSFGISVDRVPANVSFLPRMSDLGLELLRSLGLDVKRTVFVSSEYLEKLAARASLPVGRYFSGLYRASVIHISSQDSLYDLMGEGLGLFLTKDLTSQGFEVVRNDVQRTYELQKDLKGRYEGLITYVIVLIYLVLGLSLLGAWRQYTARKDEVIHFYHKDGYEATQLEVATIFESYLVHLPAVMVVVFIPVVLSMGSSLVATVLSQYFSFTGLIFLVLSFGHSQGKQPFRHEVQRGLSALQKSLILLLLVPVVYRSLDGIQLQDNIFDFQVILLAEPILFILFLTVAFGDIYRIILGRVTAHLGGLKLRRLVFSLKYVQYQTTRMQPVARSIAVGSILLSLLLLTSSVQSSYTDGVRADLGGDVALDFSNIDTKFLQGYRQNLSRLDGVDSVLTISVVKFVDYQLSDTFGSDVVVTMIGYNVSELKSFSKVSSEFTGLVSGASDIVVLQNGVYSNQLVDVGRLTPRNPSTFGKNFFEVEPRSVEASNLGVEDIWGSYWVTGQLDGYNVVDDVPQADEISLFVLSSQSLVNRVVNFSSRFLQTSLLTLELSGSLDTTLERVKSVVQPFSEVTLYSIPESFDEPSSSLYPVLRTQILLLTALLPLVALSFYEIYEFSRQEREELRDTSVQNSVVVERARREAQGITFFNYLLMSVVFYFLLPSRFNAVYGLLLLSSFTSSSLLQLVLPLLSVVAVFCTFLWAGFEDFLRRRLR